MHNEYNREQLDRSIQESQSYPIRVEYAWESRPGVEDEAEGQFKSRLEQAYPSLDEDTLAMLCLGFREAFTNALYHGNLGVPRSKFDSASQDKNLKSLNSKQITVTMECDKNKFTVTIFDEGNGFNLSEVPNPLAPENMSKDSGRGIFLYHSVFTSADVARAGKELKGMKVVLTKEFSQEEINGGA